MSEASWAPSGAADPYALQPVSLAGRRFVALANEHALVAEARAEAHDRDASFPHETFAEMQASGFLSACLPEARGGLGVTACADVAAAFCRLARGDGATALGAHMHTVTVLGLGRLWSETNDVGGTLPRWLDDLIDGVAAGQALLSVAGTEPSQTLGWFQTVGRPVDGGYAVSGVKAFGTNSPAATHLYVMFRVPARNGGWNNVVTIVERSAPGVEVLDDWESLGMRASGSNSIRFRDCFVPADRVVPVGAAREVSRYWIRFFLEGNIGLLASFVGIAERARAAAHERVERRRSALTGESVAGQAGVQHRASDLEVALATGRAVVERIARLADEFYASDSRQPRPLDEHHALMAEFQCAKLVANRAAIDVVDAAMTLAGGSAYLASSPLARLYRDVRAGPFMQAFSPIEAPAYIGQVALGVEPTFPG